MIATLDDGASLRGAARRRRRPRLAGARARPDRRRRWCYPQSAITFALRLKRPHDHCVHELLRPAGPLALLPIGPDLCSITWVETRAVADQLLRLEPESLLLELQDRVEIDLEGAVLCGQPTGHP